jgi:hypothetical protein
MTSFQAIIETALAVLAALGGGGVIVFGLSNHLGKLWADRLMQNERASHERNLADLRAEHERKLAAFNAELDAQNSAAIERMKTALDLQKGKPAGAHADKLAMYRTVTDLVAELVVEFESTKVGASNFNVQTWKRFERDRLRAYGYLGMLAPQSAMDPFDRVVDYLLAVTEGTKTFDFRRLRELAIAMIKRNSERPRYRRYTDRLSGGAVDIVGLPLLGGQQLYN